MLNEKFPKESNEHAFAPFIRALGKGKKGSRSLTREEARAAMGMILDGETLDLQLGAFLMLLRVKEETPEELAGFVEAAQARFNAPKLKVDIDWSSYAGKKRHQPWFLFSALLLSQNGYRIFMHGSEGHTQGRLYTRSLVETLGLPVAANWSEAASAIEKDYFVYMPLQSFSPRLHDIIQMRSILGLRSPVHSMARLLNPLHASLVMQGIFHPPYNPIHQLSANLLQYPTAVVIKGEGGEVERNPDAQCIAHISRQGETFEETWPPLFAQRHLKAEALSIEHMLNVWRGVDEDEYAEAAVISTLALALKYIGNSQSQQEALEIAAEWWRKRDKQRF
ncbi:Anthranilate phosphoribosyltransferase [Hahella chejuensis KCTC 2396]|uniref:Anthranilate phosphoribosyltransferase n=1 Tax=Hahella chejuensis (strain KCTC 2396) TaxID=349521 RepID=Q2SJ29_HAHCH|nr:glycosyl transferase family protein [Hahella chejuensis]ABC29345.1 Anthranilate phosphoribosyltransferase [Hahella chejuensis KCTC 2396]